MARFQTLDHKRIGEHPDKMAVLPERRSNSIKHGSNTLMLFCLTNKDATSGQIIGDDLVLPFLE
jgi:hypothetical protein